MSGIGDVTDTLFDVNTASESNPGRVTVTGTLDREVESTYSINIQVFTLFLMHMCMVIIIILMLLSCTCRPGGQMLVERCVVQFHWFQLLSQSWTKMTTLPCWSTHLPQR